MGKTLEELKKEIENGHNIKLRSKERVLSLREQYKSKLNELKALGIENPEEIESEIKKMEQEIFSLKEKIEEELPSEVISKYKNKEFTKTNSEINLDNMDF